MKILIRTHVWACLGAVALAAVSLLWAGPAPANTTVVEVLTCQPSSQGARITIDLNGKPAKDVKLIVSTLENQLVHTLTMDERGVSVLPRLAPGKYLVIARTPDNLGAGLCVEISEKKWKQVSLFSLVLNVLPPNSLTIEEMLAAAENHAPSEHIQEFHGVVVDPTGAVVVGTDIQIFPRECEPVRMRAGLR